jgi:hypothetical protein
MSPVMAVRKDGFGGTQEVRNAAAMRPSSRVGPRRVGFARMWRYLRPVLMWGSALFIVYAWAASGWKGIGLVFAMIAALLVSRFRTQSRDGHDAANSPQR